jgi:hypothetical protein
VRGADLLESTPRQIFLQRLLHVPTPRYLHVPVVRNANGEKLSKQTGALAVRPGDGAAAVAALREAAGFLGIDLPAAGSLDEFWRAAIPAWAALIAAREAAACGSLGGRLCRPPYRHHATGRLLLIHISPPKPTASIDHSPASGTGGAATSQPRISPFG